jgi:hypothetical protein
MLLALAAGLAAALPAAATPVTVFFDGPSGFGISAADAQDAYSNGVPRVVPDFVGETTGVLSVISQDLDFSGFNPILPEATSTWTVQNQSSFDLGSTYLLFVTSDDYTFRRQSVDYRDEIVGLSIDPDDEWVLVEASFGQQTFYYPAVSLGSLAAGDTAAPFDVHYAINGRAERLFSGEYVLPQLRLGMGIEPIQEAPIPEPTAAVLFAAAAGLIGLVTMRRGRS